MADNAPQPTLTPEQTVQQPEPTGTPNLFQPSVDFFGSTETKETALAQPQTEDNALQQARVVAYANMNPGAQGIDQSTDHEGVLTNAFTEISSPAADTRFRQAAALQAKAVELKTASGLSQYEDPAVAGQWRDLMARSIAQDVATKAKYALEEKAVINLLSANAAGNGQQAAIIQQHIFDQHGDPSVSDADHVLIDQNTKDLIKLDAIQKSEVAVEHQGWMNSALDYVMNVVPLHNAIGLDNSVPVAAALRHWYDWVWGAQRQDQEASNLDHVPIDQYRDYVSNTLIPTIYNQTGILGWHNQSAQLEALTKLRTQDAPWSTNLRGSIDAVALVSMLPVGRGIGFMMKLGGAKASVDLAAKAYQTALQGGLDTAAKTTGLGAEELAETLSPSALSVKSTGSPLTMTNSNVLAGNLGAITERSRAILDQIGVTPTDRVMSVAERQGIQESWEEDLRATSAGNHIKDVQYVFDPQFTDTRVSLAHIMLGPEEGVGYADEGQARNLGQVLSLPGEPVQNPSGLWHFRAELNLPENSPYAIPLNPQTTNPVSRFLMGARRVGDEGLANQAGQAADAEARTQSLLKKRWAPAWRALTGEERGSVEGLLQQSQNEKSWLTDRGVGQYYEARFGRGPTRNELNAYHAAIEQNDVDFTLKNTLAQKQAILAGKESASFDFGLGTVNNKNAYVTRGEQSLSKVNEEPVWDVTNQRLINGNMTEDDLAQANADGRVMVQLDRPLTLGKDGTEVRRFIGHPNDIDIGRVSPDQIPYAAGGLRAYPNGSYFAKQAYKTSAGIFRNPNTYRSGTKAEMTFWANTMETARQLYNSAGTLEDYLGKFVATPSNPKLDPLISKALKEQWYSDLGNQIDTVFNGHPGFGSGRQFIDDIESGVYHKDFEIGAYGDHELPPEYSQNGNDLRYVNHDETSVTSYLHTHSMLNPGPRGDRLLDWEGKLAPVLDPYETLNRSMKAIASMSSMDDFKTSAISRWVNTYAKGDFINDLPQGLSDYQIFKQAVLKDGLNPKLTSQIDGQRDIVKRILGWRTDMDNMGRSYARDLKDWVQGSDPFNSARQHAFDWWDPTDNITQRLKNFAFDVRIGMFDIARLPLHLAISSSAIAIDPVNGWRGFMGILPTRFFMAAKDSDAALEGLIAKGAHRDAGFAAGEYRNYMNTVKNGGFINVGTSSELMADAGGGLTSRLGGLQEASHVFFNLAETSNRMVASRIAWADATRKFGADAFESPEFRQFFSGRQKDLSGNMDRTSAAYWQRGVLSVPTQFWAYPARQFEMFLGNQFTVAQKTRLFLAHSLLYGSSGTAVGATISSLVQGATGQAVPEALGGGPADNPNKPLDTLYGAMDRGLLDEFFYHALGVNEAVGKRYGAGSWAPDTVKDIFGLSQFGEKSTAEMLGGASFAVGIKTLSTFLDAAKYAAAESGDTTQALTENTLLQLGDNVAALSHLHKAMMIKNYGVYLSNSDSTSLTGLPSKDAFAMALLGVQPGETLDYSAQALYLHNEKGLVDEATKFLNNQKTKYATEPDAQEDILNQTNAYTRLLDPEIRLKALRQSSRFFPQSMADVYARRYQTDVDQARMLQQIEDEGNK